MYAQEFLNDVYPGIKQSPILWAKMMATPEIKPDVSLAGKYDVVLIFYSSYSVLDNICLQN